MHDDSLEPLARALGLAHRRTSLQSLGSSAFAATFRLEIDGRPHFLKRQDASRADPLRAEADGLSRLAGSGAIRVPALEQCLDVEQSTWLILEWIDLKPLSANAATRLGRALAEQHRTATSDRHGLDRDNWIGATPQVNTPTSDWAEFLFQHRIGALIDRLAAAGPAVESRTTETLRAAWQDEFADYRPVPSLLHGDLWSGNVGMLPDGEPIVFDPAVHFGDRECDLAMAALFGGFGPEFFDAYSEAWPLEPGWALRRRFYQLVHVLNHALLFGGGYVDDARRRIEALTGTRSRAARGTMDV